MSGIEFQPARTRNVLDHLRETKTLAPLDRNLNDARWLAGELLARL